MPHDTKADKAAKVSTNEARRRKELALADMREMERDERRGTLVSAESVRDAWVTILAAVRAAVLRIPDTLAPIAAGITDPREARAALEVETEAILRNLADEVRQIPNASDRSRGNSTRTPKASVSRGMGRRSLSAQQ